MTKTVSLLKHPPLAQASTTAASRRPEVQNHRQPKSGQSLASIRLCIYLTRCDVDAETTQLSSKKPLL
jgi:hypothetical protein